MLTSNSSMSGDVRNKTLVRWQPLGEASVDVRVSDGVEILHEAPNEESAWVGRGPWRDLSAMERSTLSAQSLNTWFESLVTLDLSSDLLALAHETLIAPLTATNGARNDSLVKAIAHFRHCLRDALIGAGIKLDTAGPADVIVNPPGMRSTAYDYDEGLPRGLHIDNHQSLPLHKRADSFVLASMNIGWQSRYLHFVPAPMSTLLHKLELPETCGLLPREIKDLYFQRFSRDPIVKVTIPPGTVYLLQTQNYIHDGETAPGTIPDVVFLMMGNPS
jgi:hypothetical protein